MEHTQLQERFGGWVRFFLWNRGHKEAFELKYELIKRQLDLDRQFKEQLKTKNQRAASKSDSNANANDKRKHFQTMMQKHRERTIQCKNCSQLFIESQNTSIACAFHSKTFTLACPKSCPNPGLTQLCSAHRMRR
jgi:hypothetical protein